MVPSGKTRPKLVIVLYPGCWLQTSILFVQQVNIERDFNLKELKKAAEEMEKLRKKNAKKDKNKTE